MGVGFVHPVIYEHVLGRPTFLNWEVRKGRLHLLHFSLRYIHFDLLCLNFDDDRLVILLWTVLFLLEMSR